MGHTNDLRVISRNTQGVRLVRMEEVIERRLAELSTLLETGKAVVSTLDSQAVLDIIVDQTIRLTRADRCAILRLQQLMDLLPHVPIVRHEALQDR